MGGDKLTPKQQGFVNAYVSNGQNGTLAAKEAGYSGGENSWASMASQLLRVPKVAKAIESLVGKAIAKAERGAIADLTECLEFQTTVMRAKLADYLGDSGEVSIDKLRQAPAGLVRKLKVRSTTDAEGQVFAEHEVGLESAFAASQALARHHTGEKDPGDTGRAEIRAVIFNLIAGDRNSRSELEQIARRAVIEITPTR